MGRSLLVWVFVRQLWKWINMEFFSCSSITIREQLHTVIPTFCPLTPRVSSLVLARSATGHRPHTPFIELKVIALNQKDLVCLLHLPFDSPDVPGNQLRKLSRNKDAKPKNNRNPKGGKFVSQKSTLRRS